MRRRSASLPAPDAGERDRTFARVHALARQIPRGKVATYGQLARIVGTTPRAVGFAMAALTPADRVPWHRVVNAQGRPSLGAAGAAEQTARLSREGVRFDHGRIDLRRFGWLPADADSPDCPDYRTRTRRRVSTRPSARSSRK